MTCGFYKLTNLLYILLVGIATNTRKELQEFRGLTTIEFSKYSHRLEMLFVVVSIAANNGK